MVDLPIGADDEALRHMQTVAEAKKDQGAQDRAKITAKAMVLLRELREGEAKGLKYYTDEGVELDIDRALAHCLSGRKVKGVKGGEDK